MDDTFSAVAAAASGPLAGLYLWSNAANWSLGAPPVDGDSVNVSNTSQSYDDLAALTLASLTLGDDAVLAVTGASLDVTFLTGAAGIQMAADAFDAGTPVTITVGTITGTGGLYGAYGPGAIFVDLSAADPGETYDAEGGGLTELSATPNGGSVLDYYSGVSDAPATFAFQSPGAINAAALNNVAPDDVLELPGSSVSDVTFGPGSLSITTNDGGYTFSNVTWQDGPPAGYSAAFDSATGLEAVTFLGLDTFSQAAPVTSGPLVNDYLWSNAANWSLGGPPVDGDSVTAAEGYDDLSALTLASLTVSGDALLFVTGASLDVTSVDGTAGDLLAADASLAGTPVVVTVGTITGTGGIYEAYGAGAVFVAQSASDPGETYIAESGGVTELSATPSSSSVLEYLGAPATFVLRNPAAINAVALVNVAPGDVLELPGSSVSNVSFGPDSLNVTTNDGSYAFSNVTYADGPFTGYSVALDPATGLEAITFPGLDTFVRASPATTGPLDGHFLWSNAANWTDAVPLDGASVAAADGIDNLATLSLASLTLGGSGVVDVTGASLDVAAVYGVTGAGLVADEALAGTPATVTVGSIAGTGGSYGATGAGAVFVDQSTVDPGEAYHAGSGGFTELSATPIGGSTLEYGGANATFALRNPGTTNAFALNDVTPGDVLELPGTSVSNVSFGPGSLNVTTDDGNYAFSNVTWQDGPPIGYRAAFDPATGLEAITFLGLDVFSQVAAATSGPLANEYLWSNAANWSLGAPPIDGDSVSVTNSNAGFDDLAALSLATLTLSGNGYVNVVGSSLDVTSLIETYGGLTANAVANGTPVTVTVGTITGFGATGINQAVGAGAVFLDQSAVDVPETYLSNRGAIIELWATPNSSTVLDYGSDSTFAPRSPAASNAFPLRSVTPGDVLELPGSSVGNVSFGPHSLSITTNAGGYAFSNVTYLHEPPAGFSAAFDTATGLEAITFVTLDTFSRVSAATSGPLAGQYLWSNAANWSLGAPPEDGDTVSTAAGGYDDLLDTSAATFLTYLTNLTLTGGGAVTLSGSGLDVTSVTGGSGSLLAADSSFTGMPSDVTVGMISGTGGSYGATGSAGYFVDQSAVDPGEDYFAHNGGFTELSATPSSGSSLEYAGAHSTFALFNPGAANAVALINVAPADVLELPGSSVSNVSFGPGSLSITTNDGGYAFSNVTWQVAPPTGFSAAFDSTTGLEAITFVGPDTFLPVTAATGGPLAGFFLWSNAANWTLGAPPINGGNAAAANGIDNLAALTLASLILGGTGVVEVTGASLNVTSIEGVAGAGLMADASLTGAPVTVTVGTINGSGGSYGATGAGAVFMDQSAVDPGENYLAYTGGLTELSAAPGSGSTLEYGGTGSTFALQDPGAANGFALNNVAPGDVLELPGSSVSNVNFEPGSLSITTNDGNYAFSAVIYDGGPITGYAAAFDPTTGLEAITFLKLDTFSQVSPATSGPLAGDYLWSNAANWSLGAPPVDGDGVATGTVGYDDLAALTLFSVTLSEGGVVDVTGASLNVTSVAGGAVTSLGADALDAGTPVTVTVGTITGTGGDYGAIGAGAVFVDQSAADPGETYFAEFGGFTELSATPSNDSTLGYGGTGSTFALPNPAATNILRLNNVAPSDVLELPGSSVSSVSVGPVSINVTTDDGSYAFNYVIYDGGPITGYSAAADPATGLEAITFLGLNMFSQVSPATSGPLAGDYLWSNAANWSHGAPPVDGDSIAIGAAGYDDLAALTLASLTLSDGAVVDVTGASLDATSVTGAAGATLAADALVAGTPVTVTVGTIAGTGGDYGALGAGGVFVDQSAIDPGELYFAEAGGFTELTATPNSGSTLGYGGTDNTFALRNPGAANAFALANVAPGDVLELPGSSVSDVSFGTHSLTVTTNGGSFAFTDVTYASGQLTNYSAAFDPVTGLEAITLLGPDIFIKGSTAASGPLTGDYLWSNPANWSRGTLPTEGDTVQVATYSFDDLAALNLAGLTVNNNTYLEVTGASLDVTSFVTYGSTLEAYADYAPVTVTVGSIGGSGSNYDAIGAGAVLVAQAGNGLDQHYEAMYGGLVELSGTPDSSATLELFAASTLALPNPGATNAYFLQGAAANDVLELPGSSVSAVSFGSSSLTVTTNVGSYAFSNVAWQDGPPASYSAAFDPSTGLEAITFLGLDTFSRVSAATSGPLAGLYLWSNPANWSLYAPPIDGDSVAIADQGVDDLAALTLAGLTLNDGSSGPPEVEVVGASLEVTSVYGVLGSLLEAQTQTAGTPVTVTVGNIDGEMDVSLGAAGAGAVFVDQSTSDPGDFYVAEDGGLTEFSATPGLGTTLEFVGTPSTFALLNPGSINAFALETVAQYDVLEVPGSSVSNVSFGAGSLTITTNDGSYAFSNVTYASGQLTDYSAAVDPATGLEAITFLPTDTFSPVSRATSGPLAGDYLWSNAANWSNGAPPIDGDTVIVNGAGHDDLGSLTLASLTLNFSIGINGIIDGSSVDVIGASLNVTFVIGGDASSLEADAALVGTPVTVTVGAIGGTFIDDYGANGAGAVFVDQSAFDEDNVYHAGNGGFTELSATPNGGSALGFGQDGTLALLNPGGVNTFRLNEVAPGDVLELPGSSVSDVSFGPDSLSITTNDGGYAFSDVNYAAGAITGYRAAFDPASGLEAITFTGPDTFSRVAPAASGPLAGDYLWSNAANWSFGVPPVNGDSVSTGGVGYDDLAALTLASLTLSGGGVVNVTGASLNVTSIAGVAGAGLAADAYDAGTPVTVTVGTITGTGGNYGAAGAGAVFVDQSAVDPGATYLAELGGFTELSATPNSSSLLFYAGADSTFAPRNPGAANAFALTNVTPGDVLELPGTSVVAISQGPGSLRIVTSLGTTAFSNVTFGSPVLTYDAAPDPLTGLQAITFRDATGAFPIAQDVFEENVTSSIAPLIGQYLWSNALNWSTGAPVTGEIAEVDSLGDDDLASLTLGQLIVTGPGAVDVGAGSLLGTQNGLINAGTLANAGTVSGGVTLAGSGILVNGAGARVSGDVVATAAGETVNNLGLVSGTVTLAGGDRLVTGAGAVFGGGITGGTGGNTLEVATGPYTLTNFDAAGTPRYDTLQIDTGVSVTTNMSDLLTGVTLVNNGTLNLSAFEATMAVSNSGEITGDVTLASGVPLTNTAGGTITGSGLAVIEALGLASVMNSGLIDPATYGVDLTAGGSVTNAAGGTIEGTVAGVLISGGGGTVTNAGLISGGGTDAVTLAAGFANRVILDPGAAFNGIVDGGNTLGAGAVSTLELAAASGAGTLTGFGTKFVNFAQLAIDPGTSWNFGGGNTLAAGTTLTDQGALTLSGTSVAGGGAVMIDATAGLPASATVADAGSWTGNSRFVIGATGAGDLLLESAGSVSVAAADVAQSAGSSGGITVTGTNSLLNDAGSLMVGDGGLGSLAIQSGGTVIAGTGLTIANQASASGSSVNVAGAGSNLQITGLLDAGVSGSGALSISYGATVSASSLDAANSLAAVANINVSDASLIITGSATVADDGTAVLSVLGGATVSAANLTIGSRGDSSGAVVVSGQGSVVNIAGDLNVGTSLGTGDLTIGPGAVVNAKVVNLQGEVVLENGELDPTVNLINQGQTAGGSGTIAAGDIVDEGVIQAGGSKPSQKLLVVSGTVLGGGPWTIDGTAQAQANGGVGVLQINAGGTLELTGPVLNAGSTTFTDDVTPQSTYTVTNSVVEVNFADATGVLKLDDIAGFAGTIAAVQKGDSFVVTGGTLSNLGVTGGNTLTVSDSGNGGTDGLIFASSVSAGGFSIVNGNTIQVACFARGTRIATDKGLVTVEDLRAGDRVITHDGPSEPIVWIGQRTVNCERHSAPETVWPVRVSAGAFGRGKPRRDLYLSPDHAVFVNDVLVPVKLLINGASIAQVKRGRVTYHHVELSHHAVILAEGLTVESYLDLGDRANFIRTGETIRLFPDFAARLAPDTALPWETRGAAPLVMAGEALAKARRLIASHAPRRACRSGTRVASGLNPRSGRPG